MGVREVPDILVIGHVALQIATPEPRPAGTGAYASLVAAQFGPRTALLTCAGPDLKLADLLPGVDIALAESTRTTVMGDICKDGRRIQQVRQLAAPIDAGALPTAWRDARLLLLAPLFGEVDPKMARE